MQSAPSPTHSHIALIGAGVMSATLGTLFKQLAPEKSIAVFERLDAPALESSNECNNAGTGHAALCELNYTPQQADGGIDIARAAAINEKFMLSLQLWAYLAKQGLAGDPRGFIRRLPHISFVTGGKDVQFLKARHTALTAHPLFAGMEYAEDEATLRQWLPLMMQVRTSGEPAAATRTANGTDVNFGELARRLCTYLAQNGATFRFNSNVTAINRTAEGKWMLAYLHGGTLYQHTADFVFIGAGGGSLHLLQKSGIPEGEHIGGFPVGGLFMVCRNEAVIARHFGKAYGKAKTGAPPMSVPHLDTRYINGRQTLLFGPFAGFSPKFLKHGSLLDIFASIKPHNLCTVLSAGAKNTALTKYLIEQVMLNKEQRMAQLREFIPEARDEDWELVSAGQRVQIIKDTATGRGTLQFGTELITSADGTLAALLGASPGASTSAAIALELLQKCFSGCLADWEETLKTIIPSYGKTLAENPELLQRVSADIAEALQFDEA